MSKKAILETPEKCKGCHYRHVSSGISLCGYSFFMGEPRNCSIEECTHYSDDPRGRKFRKEKLEKRSENGQN